MQLYGERTVQQPPASYLGHVEQQSGHADDWSSGAAVCDLSSMYSDSLYQTGDDALLQERHGFGHGKQGAVANANVLHSVDSPVSHSPYGWNAELEVESELWASEY